MGAGFKSGVADSATSLKRLFSALMVLATKGELQSAPRANSGVAAFMSAHSKTPWITPSMDCSSGKGVVRGRRGQQMGFT